MSKRFGRNQKRKMREALQEGNLQIAKLQRELLRVEQLTQVERECLEMTEELLGEYFPTLVPKTHEVSSSNFSLPSCFMPKPTAYEMQERILNFSFSLHQLRSIEYSAEVDKLREMLYLRVNTPEGATVAYNFNFSRMPEKFMETVLKRDLVPNLVREIKRKINQ